MSDRLNNELLSAYLDHEVTEEERAQVEQALVDSPETRMALESLRQMQSSLRSFPRLTLPDDFHERVLREAERRSAAQGVAANTIRSVSSAKWLRIAGVAAAVAAVLVVAVIIAVNQREAGIVENPVPGGTDIVEQNPPLPGDNIIARGGVRADLPQIMVYDFAITKQGQRANAFGKTVRGVGVAFDPRKKGVVLDAKHRDGLLKSRLAAEVHQEATSRVNERFDIIEIVYLRATGPQVDAIWERMGQNPQVRRVLDVAYMPESLRVLNSMGEKAYSLAQSEPAGVPRSYAYRVNVGISLHSSRSGFLAKFPTPRFDLGIGKERDSGSNKSFELPFDFGGHDQPLPDNANGNPAAGARQGQIEEIVVILRNLAGDFPNNAQKPDAK